MTTSWHELKTKNFTPKINSDLTTTMKVLQEVVNSSAITNKLEGCIKRWSALPFRG